MAAAAAALAACNAPPPAPPSPAPGSPEALVAYLQAVVGAGEATRQREVATWQLDEPLWRRTVVPPYRPLHADYARAFAAEAPALVAQLGHAGAITARRHYAGDPRLTPAQGRDRWALPVLFPSMVAEAGGAPIAAVFVPDGDHWRALLGLDTVVRARVTALDPACGARLALAGPTGRCTDVGAAIAAAALRMEPPPNATRGGGNGPTPPTQSRGGDGNQKESQVDAELPGAGPRDATRGGVNGPAPPVHSGRERPLSTNLAHVCRLAETLCGKESP